jgi:hypothetical protein
LSLTPKLKQILDKDLKPFVPDTYDKLYTKCHALIYGKTDHITARILTDWIETLPEKDRNKILELTQDQIEKKRMLRQKNEIN